MPSLSKIGNLILITFLVLVFGVPAYQAWAKERAAQIKQEEITSIGFKASSTAEALWSSVKYCRDIGIPQLEQCANHKGPLLDDTITPVFAKMALEQRVAYDAMCLKHYSSEYCTNLLTRAFHIAQNKDD